MSDRYPLPLKDESPSSYSNRVGRWYSHSISDGHKKALGQYLTPIDVARLMVNFLSFPDGDALRILDPGAGAGILSCVLCEELAKPPNRIRNVELVAYEADRQLAELLRSCLDYTAVWLKPRGIMLTATVYNDDFILAHASALEESQLSLLPLESREGNFDIAMSNPPYFKLQKSDPRALAASKVVHGQPNIYALFMAVTASAMKKGGEMAFITPRSYTAGPYFRLFREVFFHKMKPLAIHLFGSRRDAFRRDEILQENVILTAKREDNWWPNCQRDTVLISSCVGLCDLLHPQQRILSIREILDMDTKDKVLRIPITEEDTTATIMIDEWSGNLRSYGLEISTGPVVPFRAKQLITKERNSSEAYAPLLWMQNITAMTVQWPSKARNKTQYIISNKDSIPLLVADRNYVILRRFSSKEQHRRLTAAPLIEGTLKSSYIGLENHLNYIHRPGGSLSVEEAYGLAGLFNSMLLDTFFRISNGNTQVSATELRAMPLPPIDVIREIGKSIMSSENPLLEVDDIVESIIGTRYDIQPLRSNIA